MSNAIELFSKVYADEDFAQDIESDISWIYETEKYKSLPEDEYGFKSGSFKVTVTWEDEE